MPLSVLMCFDFSKMHWKRNISVILIWIQGTFLRVARPQTQIWKRLSSSLWTINHLSQNLVGTDTNSYYSVPKRRRMNRAFMKNLASQVWVTKQVSGISHEASGNLEEICGAAALLRSKECFYGSTTHSRIFQSSWSAQRHISSTWIINWRRHKQIECFKAWFYQRQIRRLRVIREQSIWTREDFKVTLPHAPYAIPFFMVSLWYEGRDLCCI